MEDCHTFPAVAEWKNVPINMPDQIRLGSEALARSGPDNCCTPALFRTGSVWPKPDTVSHNQIGSGLVLHNVIRAVCRTEYKSRNLVAGAVVFWQKPGPMILAHWLSSAPDPFGQNLTSHPDLIRSGPVCKI